MKGVRFYLSYFQTKLAYTKPTGQRQKTLYHVCISSSFTPSPRGVMWSKPGRCCAHSGFVSQLRNLRNPQQEPKSFKIDCRQICLTFLLKRDITFFKPGSKRICPLLQRETLSLSSKAISSETSLKR